MDLYSYRCPDARMKKTIIGSGIDYRFKFLARRVIVDNLDGKYRTPYASLLWNAPVVEREGFINYAQTLKKP